MRKKRERKKRKKRKIFFIYYLIVIFCDKYKIKLENKEMEKAINNEKNID